MHNGQAVYSVDRKNNDGDYAPGNVRWATRKEQQENKRKVASLRSFTVAELVAELKLRGVTCGS
jgi:hypothetical protein